MSSESPSASSVEEVDPNTGAAWKDLNAVQCKEKQLVSLTPRGRRLNAAI